MKRRRVVIWRTLGVLTGICIVLLISLRPWERHRPHRPSPDKKATGLSAPRSRRPPRRLNPSDQTPGQASAVRFGILGPERDGTGWYHPLFTALKWMDEWGHSCDVVAPPGTDPASLRSLLQAKEIDAEIRSFDTALAQTETLLVILETRADNTTIRKLKSYVSSGGWLVAANNPQVVRKIAGLPVGPIVKLNSMWNSVLRTRSSMARFLVAHPLLPGAGGVAWFPIPALEGEVEASRPTKGLWLIAFRNPSSPGLRILPLKKGGVVEIGWQVHQRAKLKEADSREVLRNTVAWLSKKELWLPPERLPLQEVTGSLVDGDGSPIAEAEVSARVFADWGVQVEEIRTKTDRQGNFSLPAKGPSIYWFKASAEGLSQEDPFVMARCEEEREQQPVTIVMRRTADLFGTVYYDGREEAPAPEFPVTLLPTDRDPEIERQTTVSDQQGQFGFENVPYGKTFLVMSEKGEWGGWRMVEMPLDPREDPERVAVAIERIQLVYGRIVEHETYKPIPGASVDIHPCQFDRTLTLFSGSLTRMEKCDEEKGFSFRLLPGWWWVQGAAEGYWGASAWEDGEHKPLSWVRMKVASRNTDPESPLLFQLRGPVTFRWTRFYGTVYLPSGDPAPNAFICSQYGEITTSDSEGRYETAPLAPQSHPTFWFITRCQNCMGYQTVQLEEPPERYHLDLWLEEGKAARGFVRDVKGNPVEGARVTVVWSNHQRFEGIIEMAEAVLSAADGSFSLPGVAFQSDEWSRSWGSSIRLRAEKVVRTGEESVIYAGTALVTPPESGPIEDFDIVIARAGPIEGTISYHDGTPMRNACGEVGLSYGSDYRGIGFPYEHWVHFDDRGGFGLEVPPFHQNVNLHAREEGRENWRSPPTLPPESYELRVVRSHEVEQGTLNARNTLIVKGIQPGMTDLDIRFPPMGSVRGRVIDGDTGLPIENFTVHGHQKYDHETDPRPPGPCWTGEVNLDGLIGGGEFNLRDLVPGPYGIYRLSIWCDNYTDRWYMEIPVAENQTTELGDIRLYRNWWVKGRVVAAQTGRPIPATVTGAGGLSTTTEDDGYFVLAIPGDTLHCRVEVMPTDKTWQGTRVRASFRAEPTVDVGNVILRPASPE